jgi:hypothetical protein
MTDQWTPRLSEYLDGELEPGERVALEQHLSSCDACTGTLDELRAVVARASALPSRPPAADLWPSIEPRLDPITTIPIPLRPRVTRRFSFTAPQLVAAGLALMVMSGGAVWVLQHGGRATELPPLAATSHPDAGALPVSIAEPRYDEAIADLQQVLSAGRSQLDAGTVRILEANLEAIDRAIQQSQRALASDPGNVYLHSHLAEARQRKLALLRRGVALVNGKS